MYLYPPLSSTYTAENKGWTIACLQLPEFISVFQVSDKNHKRFGSRDANLLQTCNPRRLICHAMKIKGIDNLLTLMAEIQSD
jgi:hypothetical protein